MRMLQALAVLGLAGGLLPGCDVTAQVPAAVATASVIGTIPVFKRSPLDVIYSGLTGRDCSIVRLDEGKTYCRPVDPPPEAPVFCTHSLARVDCWADPASLPGRPTPVADGPTALTPAQEANRVRTWP
jgi:hypothetical protein